MTPEQAQAMDRFLRVAEAGPDDTDERARMLAIQWPSLAAALGDLLEAYEVRPPRPWRAAARLLAEERRGSGDYRAVTGMGACGNCGHMRHQHKHRGCMQCSVCAGWVAP